jgi:signal transduction histidine kinase
MDAWNVLVVAGDYELIEMTEEALDDPRFIIQTAFSHRDALNSIRLSKFDLIIVDAAMVSRVTGIPAIDELAMLNPRPPLVALNLSGGNGSIAQLPMDAVIHSLDTESIQHGVSEALNIYLAPTSRLDGENHAPAPMLRNEELETLFALSRSLTEVLDTGEVLNRVVEAARNLTQAEEGMILLPDGDTGELFLRARVGIDIETARNFRIKQEDTIAGDVFNNGQAVMIGAAGPLKVKTRYFVNALLYVPILLKGKPIGVLGVNNRDKHDVFNEGQQALLINLASFAAIALENARIHEESLKRTRELKALADASQVMNSSLSLDRTLPNISEQLARVLNVGRAEIYEWLPEGKQLRLLSFYQRVVWRSHRGPPIDLVHNPTLLAALTSKYPMMIVRGDGMDNLLQMGAAAMTVLPVSLGDQPLGIIEASYIHRPSGLPSQDIVQRVQRVAMEGMVALFEKADQTQNQNVFRILDNINRQMESDWSDFALVNPDTQGLNLYAAVGKGVWLTPDAIDLNQYPDLLEAIEHQSPIHQQGGTGTMTPGVRRLMSAARGRSVLGLPLVQRGEMRGLVLFVDNEQSRMFNKREIDLARAIIGQSATALDNARLVSDLEDSLTQLQKAQERLIQTERLSAMGELAAAVAHQINNPLTSILLDVELMLSKEPKDTDRYRTFESINRAGKRAAGVVHRLLAASRKNSPDEPMTPVDVVSSVDDIVLLVRSHIERDHIRLIYDRPEKPMPMVTAVPTQLDDVWLNLLLNANDALRGRKGAEMGISIACPPPGDHVEVLVWDNGPGIPAEIQGRVFQPFFTTKPVGEGTGLGLHICRQTVERGGGSISLQSSYNEGTRFVVRLPVRTEA